MWAVEHWGVEPDILLTAKGIASGMPLGAMVARADLLETWGPGAHGSTYGGNPVACAAALATIDLLEGGLIANAASRGEQALAGLRPLVDRFDGLVTRRPRHGPDARRRVRHGRARRGGPVGLLRARPARPRVRQVERPDVAGADRQEAEMDDGAADLRRGRRGRSPGTARRSSPRRPRPARSTRSRPPADRQARDPSSADT